jgi:hypothetical protein
VYCATESAPQAFCWGETTRSKKKCSPDEVSSRGIEGSREGVGEGARGKTRIMQEEAEAR